MLQDKKLVRKLLCATMLSSMAAFAAPTAFAQEAEDAAEETADRIVVTGSRIRRDSNLDSSIPVTTIGAIELQQSSAFNAAEIIRDLPSAGVPGLTSTTTNFSVFSAGLESVDLRNLGDSRTLTLVDGRRVVPSVPNSSVVDFSMIPPEFIENIEVVTGGASSVYGSEAIAGVVNIQLRDDFEGVELTTRYGQSFDHGNAQSRISLTTGTGLGEDGNFLMNVTYASSEGIKATDTDYTTDLFGVTGVGVVISPLFSSFPEQGRYSIDGASDLTIADNGEVVPWTRDQGFNRQENRRLLIPQERFSVAAKSEYQLNDWMRLSSSILFATVSSDSDIEPFPFSSDDIYDPRGTLSNPGVPITNPLIPQDIRDAMVAAGDDTLTFARRMSEIADREGRFDRDTLDISVQLDGDLPGFVGADRDFLNNWGYTGYVNWGRSSQARVGAGQINVLNARYALDVIDDGAGNLVCRDETARAFGCVPLDIFGKGAISEEAAAYIGAPGLRTAETEQLVMNLAFSGDVIELPAGPMGAAFGVEYREIEGRDTVDALTASGQNAGNAIESTVGSFDVREYFGEILVPVLSDVGFLDSLDFEAAYRYADYSTAGGNDSWKYGVTASLFDEQLRFRAVGARASRAPDIGDLFSGNSQSFSSTTDPCEGVGPADVGSTDPVIASCLALPGVQAAIAAGDDFRYTDIEIQSQYFFSSGSELLDPETSDSYTIGFIAQPDFIEGLTASIDYVNFEISDAITSLSRSDSAQLCLENGNNPNDPFCQNIVRDAATSKIQYAFQVPINAATFKTDAIDVQVNYANDVPSQWFGAEPGAWGDFSARLLYTYTNSYEFQGDEESVASDFMGGDGYPYHRFNFSLNYFNGPLAVTYRVLVLSDQDFGVADDCDQATIDLYANFYGAPNTFCYDPGEPWYDEHSISARYTLDEQGLEFFGGVDNIFDEFVYLPSGYPGNVTGTETNGGIFDAIGRRFYVGVRKTW